jgi:hypothetical protein
MLFGFGKKPAAAPSAENSKASSSGRPTAGAAKKGVQKTRVTAPENAAKQPAAPAPSRIQMRNTIKKGPSGMFTPEQFEKFTAARQVIPSGAPNYW